MAGAGECAGQVGAVPVPATRLVAQLTLVNIMTTTLTRSVACRAGAAVATCSHGASQVMHRGKGGGGDKCRTGSTKQGENEEISRTNFARRKTRFLSRKFYFERESPTIFLDSKSVLGYETARFAKLKIRETA